ncbi:MAG TPA: hypothetical protein PKO33_11140, partial [Pyrinomonadaceae bacterium]|nr:hypothetical protein [Pyrinomonadaceae bacterium]
RLAGCRLISKAVQIRRDSNPPVRIDQVTFFMTLTWIAIIASLLMGAGAALIFIFAAKRDYFRDIEEAKYQVFWSDIEELVNEVEEEESNERKT